VDDHPRPQHRRAWWRSLDGTWDFAMESRARWSDPADVRWGRRILVPFAPETRASGIDDTDFHEVCWYRRTIDPPPLEPGQRLVVHFNAVDYAARVWVAGVPAATHEGGYTPFSADLTAAARAGGPIEIVVAANDDPLDLAKPRGKQDWQREPHSIWYPRTSGIWQTVWLEVLPETCVGRLRWTPNLERWELGLETRMGGRERGDLRLAVELTQGDRRLASDVYSVDGSEVNRRIALSDPGIDDYRNELLWSPHSPTLIEAKVTLLDGDDRPLDSVSSYTALRSIGIQGQALVLNGRPFPLRMVLDQGYWPETGLTPPGPEALRRDVELVKAMGFNGVRKHQKIEDARYLYWADRLGLLVWTEMPSAYRFTERSIARLTREWLEVIERDVSHPCIAAWVPFNESWGVPNLPDIAAQRHFVQALYNLTRTLDPTRPVVGNDGWESAATDLIGIHDYDDDPERIARRYQQGDDYTHLFRAERPGGRLLTLEGHPHAGQPVMLSEFGGIAYCEDEQQCWGYSMATSARDFERRYTALLDVVRQLPALAGFCYTQFADTYQEANGLLFADRRPKIPIERIADATRGRRVARVSPSEAPAADDPAAEDPDAPGSPTPSQPAANVSAARRVR
jgi:beta-galactosidase/beta-glucuronidase